MAPTHTLPPGITLLHDLPTPSFVPIRYRPGNQGTWSGHLAFANDLIADIRPSVIVELGTHWGESYFTFCQSVFQNGINCLCYAVDHWLGEPHAGFYGEEVYQDVQRFNEAHYRGFSYLLRTSFDDAALQFANNSIDLLHIDGFHTYEAASHDFHTWLPKLKQAGIILMHDVAVRHADFGVWRLWDELQAEFGQTFTFYHCWGLGVLQKPDAGPVQSPLLDLLFNSSPSIAERIRRQYVMYAAYLENTKFTEAKPAAVSPPAVESSTASGSDASHANVQIYPCGDSGYSEDTSLTQQIAFDRWEELSFILPPSTGDGPVRIDPSDCVSLIEIRKLTLRDEATGDVLSSAEKGADFKDFEVSGSAVLLNGDAPCCIFSYSKDPRISLPIRWHSRVAVRLEISMRVQSELTEVADAVAEARAEIARLGDLVATTEVRIRQEAGREIGMLQEFVDVAEDRAKEAAQEVTVLTNGRLELEKQLQSVHEMLQTERAMRVSMQQSKSWSLTKPLRDFMRVFKG